MTGASSGIGAEIARQMAGAGATVVVNYVSDSENAGHVVADIERAGGKAVAIRADVSDKAQVQAMFSEAIAALGSIDILVNNAGIQKDSTFLDMSLEDWNWVIAVNLTGYFLCAREGAREFMRRSPSTRSRRARSSVSPRCRRPFLGLGALTTRCPRAASPC